ncbi:SdrD B-like domain-containing protein, partial [Acinetobacter baumannii]
RNGVQDAGEVGVPGVRIYLEDGSYVVTDSEGKYDFYGISAKTHVLKVDRTSLPVDSELVLIGNRQAGDPNSRFVDLK